MAVELIPTIAQSRAVTAGILLSTVLALTQAKFQIFAQAAEKRPVMKRTANVKLAKVNLAVSKDRATIHVQDKTQTGAKNLVPDSRMPDTVVKPSSTALTGAGFQICALTASPKSRRLRPNVTPI